MTWRDIMVPHWQEALAVLITIVICTIVILVGDD